MERVQERQSKNQIAERAQAHDENARALHRSRGYHPSVSDFAPGAVLDTLESAEPDPFVEDARLRLWLAPALQSSQDPLLWRESGELLLTALATGELAGSAGRGSARVVRLGAWEGVWRRNRHGGLLGKFRGDRYRSARRLRSEIALVGLLRGMDVATPPVLLGLAARRGGAWRQHLVTLRVPGARTVFEACNEPGVADSARVLLSRLYEVGLMAPDLHPANLLWQSAEKRCWLVDLAGARLLGRPLTPAERAARDARFLRYFRKHAKAVPAAFTGWLGTGAG